jgi:hypothetical protein
MSARMVLLPVFILALLSLVLLLWGDRLRYGTGTKSAGSGSIELQVSFYALIALALPLRHADLVIVLLSWVFVVAWIVNAGFLSAGDATQRSSAWTASALVLLAMWIYFALRILLLI